MIMAKITGIKRIPKPGKRYDLVVRKNHNFFANNLLVHNCTSIYTSHCHARSVDGQPHPSQDWVRRLAREKGYLIPPDWRICGENLYATHSIHYTHLPTYFLVFGIYEGSRCMSWDETTEWTELLDLQTVPVLYRGPWKEEWIKTCYTGKSVYGPLQEGYVVRTTCSFMYDQFDHHVAKWVRANHVTTDSHWKHKPIRPNGLAP